MISEVILLRKVTFRTESLKGEGFVSPLPRSLIMTRLLKMLASERVSEVHGYFLGVTGLLHICKGVVDAGGDITFSVVFKCRTFRLLKGETLNGVVHVVFNNGVFLRCGPIRRVYIGNLKMPGYALENPNAKNRRFVAEDRGAIETGVVLCFTVMATRWRENNIEVLGSLDGESLGPVLFPAAAELDL